MNDASPRAWCRLRRQFLAACALAVSGAAGATDILFTSNRDAGMFQLYTMAADGSNVKRATDEAIEASEFELSPDRSKAVFVSTRKGRPDLFIADLSSGKVSQLTDDQALETTPTWSPDGRKVVFLSYRTGRGQLHIIDVDGSNLRKLTQGSGEESQPVFSPDGSKVVYTVKLDRREANLRVVDVATGQFTIIGQNPAKAVEIEPQWSPDGKRLAFVVMSGDATNVYTMNADGSERRALTSSEGYDRNNSPRWSADGQKLVFLGLRRPSARQAIYVINADGSGAREVIGGLEEHLVARWTPKGDEIVFVRFQGRGGQIFAARADGSGLRKLSDGKAYDADFAIRGPLQPTQTAATR
jgi:TolB protein